MRKNLEKDVSPSLFECLFPIGGAIMFHRRVKRADQKGLLSDVDKRVLPISYELLAKLTPMTSGVMGVSGYIIYELIKRVD